MPCPSQTSGFNVPNYVRRLADAIEEKRPGRLHQVLLQHDNALPHSANMTKAAIQKIGWEGVRRTQLAKKQKRLSAIVAHVERVQSPGTLLRVFLFRRVTSWVYRVDLQLWQTEKFLFHIGGRLSVLTSEHKRSVNRVGEGRMMLKLIRKRKRKWLGHWLRKKLPTEGCTTRNGERERSSEQKKISDDKRH
ncbi:hypothetical protein ANN_00665 [Periplaneta americana]|uniref:Uncharacterized protein n=1 Tax=Periplaneta americana TaxID=6978 RepID=A0ABQ8TU99_PERAM|nr:hypothetical protein ANN_00665 [Periplaneta americana]